METSKASARGVTSGQALGLESRGFVKVVQQPDMTNGYTLTLRIEDRQDGISPYRILLDWQSGMERVDAFAGSPLTVASQLPESPLNKEHKPKRAEKAKAEKVKKDVRWEENGEHLNISGRAVWNGSVTGTARLSISETGVVVQSGAAKGECTWIGGPSAPKNSARVLSLSERAHAETVVPASPRNDYTLVEVTGGPGPIALELAW